MNASAKPVPATIKMLPVKRASGTSHLNVLLYGAPGVGKTTFLGTSEDDPRCGGILGVDFDNGLTSVAHREGIDWHDTTGEFKRDIKTLMDFLEQAGEPG